MVKLAKLEDSPLESKRREVALNIKRGLQQALGVPSCPKECRGMTPDIWIGGSYDIRIGKLAEGQAPTERPREGRRRRGKMGSDGRPDWLEEEVQNCVGVSCCYGTAGQSVTEGSWQTQG